MYLWCVLLYIERYQPANRCFMVVSSCLQSITKSRSQLRKLLTNKKVMRGELAVAPKKGGRGKGGPEKDLQIFQPLTSATDTILRLEYRECSCGALFCHPSVIDRKDDFARHCRAYRE